MRIAHIYTYLGIFVKHEKWCIYIYTQYVYIVYGKNTDEHPHPRFHPRFTQSTCSAKPMIRRQVTWRHCQLQLCFLPGLRGSNFPSSDMGSFWKIAEELNENHGIVFFCYSEIPAGIPGLTCAQITIFWIIFCVLLRVHQKITVTGASENGACPQNGALDMTQALAQASACPECSGFVSNQNTVYR